MGAACIFTIEEQRVRLHAPGVEVTMRSVAERWLTTQQAAELGGYHPNYIRRLIREGEVKARKFGPVWQVDRASLLAYVRKVERAGAKRGPKPMT